MGTFGNNDAGAFGAGTPQTPAQRELLVTQIANEVTKYGLDGVDFDDEWSEKTGGGAVIYNAASGVNNANFIISMRNALGAAKTITVFEWHSARFLPKEIEVYAKAGGGYLPGDIDRAGETRVTVESHIFYDYATEASYGSWNQFGYANGSSTNAATMVHPTTKYAPVGINLDTRNPIYSSLSTYFGNGSTYFMSPYHNGSSDTIDSVRPYGANMWYALRNRAWYTASSTWSSSPRTPEEYISRESQAVYGENVIYIGLDYPQDWAKY
jgi:hypothetical protein